MLILNKGKFDDLRILSHFHNTRKIYGESAVEYVYAGRAESCTGEFREIVKGVKFPANYFKCG